MFTQFSLTVVSVVPQPPSSTTSIVLAITPSGAPAPSLTNTQVNIVFKGGDPTVSAQLVSTSTPCLWTSASPIMCTVIGLSPATGYQFQAQLAATQSTGALSIASAMGQ